MATLLLFRRSAAARPWSSFVSALGLRVFGTEVPPPVSGTTTTWTIVEEVKRVKDVHELSRLLKGKALDRYMVSAAMSKLRRLRRPKKALSIFDRATEEGLEHDVFTYSAAIAAAERMGDWKRALRLLSEMVDAGIEPTKVSFTAAIAACEKGGHEALDLFIESQEPLTQNVASYNATILALGKRGLSEKAFELFERMRAKGPEPDSETYEAALAACDDTKTLDLFEDMRHRNLDLTLFAFNKAIASLKKDSYEKALELYEDLKKAKGLEPNRLTHRALIAASEDCFQEKAQQIFLEAYAKNHYPGVITETALDLRDLDAPEARTALRITLTDLKSTHKLFYKSPLTGDFLIIFGSRKQEPTDSQLRPAILAFFQSYYDHLKCHQDPHHRGRLIITEGSLRAYMTNDSSKKEKSS